MLSFSRGDALGPAETAIDVGPDSLEVLLELMADAGTVLVYGPLGLVEIADGAGATRDVLAALDERLRAGKGEGKESKEDAGAAAGSGDDVILVGGATAAFAERAGLCAAATTSISGAALLCNRVLPGLALLTERDDE